MFNLLSILNLKLDSELNDKLFKFLFINSLSKNLLISFFSKFKSLFFTLPITKKLSSFFQH
jgi:hypothetical protein